MLIEEALQLAAKAWCDKRTEHLVMQPELAQVFAEILVRETEDLERKLWDLTY